MSISADGRAYLSRGAPRSIIISEGCTIYKPALCCYVLRISWGMDTRVRRKDLSLTSARVFVRARRARDSGRLPVHRGSERRRRRNAVAVLLMNSPRPPSPPPAPRQTIIKFAHNFATSPRRREGELPRFVFDRPRRLHYARLFICRFVREDYSGPGLPGEEVGGLRGPLRNL